MASTLWFVSAVAVILFQLAYAQFPPKPENVTILNSRFDDGVYISYKEVSDALS